MERPKTFSELTGIKSLTIIKRLLKNISIIKKLHQLYLIIIFFTMFGSRPSQPLLPYRSCDMDIFSFPENLPFTFASCKSLKAGLQFDVFKVFFFFFFSNFRRFLFKKKPHIFLIAMKNCTVEKCSVWKI